MEKSIDHTKHVVYECTETFLSEQIRSMVNEILSEKPHNRPIKSIFIENAIKAITEFLVVCHRSDVSSNTASMCRQLQNSLFQARGKVRQLEESSDHVKYYRLQLTIYEKLVEESIIYVIFCMPTLNSLAASYLKYTDDTEALKCARKCLDKVNDYHRKFMESTQKIPKHMIEHADKAWIENRTKSCEEMVEYFHTVSIKICSTYYFLAKNYRISMKVGLRYLRCLGAKDADEMKTIQWIEMAIPLSVRCAYSRALPQAVFLLKAASSLIDEIEEKVKDEEHNNCVYSRRVIHPKRYFIKQQRTEIEIAIVRIAIWTLEESFKRITYYKEAKNDVDITKSAENFDLYTKIEDFSLIQEEKAYPDFLPIKLCLEQKEFGALQKKARYILKLHKKDISKSSTDISDLQHRLLKIAQMRI